VTNVDVNDQVGDYGSAISRASENGHYQIIQWLLNHGADPNIVVDSYSNNALWAASNNGHYRIADLLLDNGAEINAQDEMRNFGTALLVAAFQGHGQIVQLLLDRGADVNTLCMGLHASALQAALAGGHIDCADASCTRGRRQNRRRLLRYCTSNSFGKGGRGDCPTAAQERG
jgi:ankyrin repeat protein